MISTQFLTVNETITDLKNKMALLQTQLKMMEKMAKKEESMVQKKMMKQLKETGSTIPRKPSACATTSSNSDA